MKASHWGYFRLVHTQKILNGRQTLNVQLVLWVHVVPHLQVPLALLVAQRNQLDQVDHLVPEKKIAKKVLKKNTECFFYSFHQKCTHYPYKIYERMCKALISLPTSEETSGEVAILLVTSREVSNL